jgi:hypothetical protein
LASGLLEVLGAGLEAVMAGRAAESDWALSRPCRTVSPYS